MGPHSGSELQEGDRTIAAADDFEPRPEELFEEAGLEDLRRRAAGEHLAGGEGEQTVAEQRGEVEVVGGEDHGASGLRLHFGLPGGMPSSPPGRWRLHAIPKAQEMIQEAMPL